MQRPRSTALSYVQIAFLAFCPSYMAGCAPLGRGLTSMTLPQPPAQYIPQKTNMLVLVQNHRDPASMQFVCELLDRQVTYQLVQHHVAPIVNPDRLVEFRQANSKKFSSMEIAAIGKALGAKQVLYADLVDFRTERSIGGDAVMGQGEANVKVIDVATGEVRWPQETADGQPVTAETAYIPLQWGATEGTVEKQVEQELADEVAKLFYGSETDHLQTHEPIAPVGGE